MTFEAILVSVDFYQRYELPRPAWLQKQVDGLYLSETDPVYGFAMIVDGLLDQRDALDQAKYKPYRPEAK